MAGIILTKQLKTRVNEWIDERLNTLGVIIPRSQGNVGTRGITIPPGYGSTQSVADTGQNTAAAVSIGSTRIIEGFDLMASRPPDNKIWITNRAKAFSPNANHRAIINGKYVELKGNIDIDISNYLAPDVTRVIYIFYDDKGYSISDGKPYDKLELGRIVLNSGCMRIVDDYDSANPDAYIIGSKDPFYEDFFTDDDTMAVLKNSLDVIFAKNIFGSLTLSEFLKIVSQDGRVNITGDGIDIYNNDDNLIVRLGKDGLMFYNTAGLKIAEFGPYGDTISGIELVNNDTLIITDDNGVIRVQLGLLQDGTYGIQFYDADGNPGITPEQITEPFADIEVETPDPRQLLNLTNKTADIDWTILSVVTGTAKQYSAAILNLKISCTATGNDNASLWVRKYGSTVTYNEALAANALGGIRMEYYDAIAGNSLVSQNQTIVPLSNVAETVIDDCKTANWEEGADAGPEVLVTNPTPREGTYCLGMPRNSTVKGYAQWFKNVTVDMLSENNEIYMYFWRNSFIASYCNYFRIRLYCGGSIHNYYQILNPTINNNVWNQIGGKLSTAWVKSGTPDYRSLTALEIYLRGQSATGTWLSSQVAMDKWFLVDTTTSDYGFQYAFERGGGGTYSMSIYSVGLIRAL